MSSKFAKLRASPTFAPNVSSRHCALRTLRALVPYVPWHLTRLRALPRSLFTCLIDAPCAPSLRALHALSTHLSILFVHLIQDGLWTIKDSANRVFMWVKKENFLMGKSFKHI